MKTLNLTPEIRAALLQSVEMSIDMFNDMVLDPMWMTPTQLRELAGKSDEEIRATFTKNGDEVFKNIDQLVSLQILYSELKAE